LVSLEEINNVIKNGEKTMLIEDHLVRLDEIVPDLTLAGYFGIRLPYSSLVKGVCLTFFSLIFKERNTFSDFFHFTLIKFFLPYFWDEILFLQK